ncbi:hypothetical protein TNCV_1380351 [Trichonephila clavipes]|nr:hypothetical protein TNCV_1380351 [Trichonephila clavipes]
MFQSSGQSDAKPQCIVHKQAWYSFIDSLNGWKAELTLLNPWFEPRSCGVETRTLIDTLFEGIPNIKAIPSFLNTFIHFLKNNFFCLKLKHLRFDIFKLQETKFPIQLINTTNEQRLAQEQEATLLRVKGDIGDVSSELHNGDRQLHFLDETPRTLLLSARKASNKTSSRFMTPIK